MKKLFAIVFILFVFATISQAQVFSTTTGGEWDQTTTWANGVVPGATDSVIIQGPVRLYFDAPTILHLNITENGSLESGWESAITVFGNVWVTGVVNCYEGNFEFYIGGNLHADGNWIGDLTFTGTIDHYFSMANNISFNPSGHLFALESKIIALSDIHISSINYPNIVAKEIDLSGGFSLYLSKIRLGQAYYFTNGNIRTKITGGTGSSIYMNVDSPTYMDQWFIEYCDLFNVTLKGNTFLGAEVRCFGEVINGDSLYTAVGTGSWVVEVEGNFTNNGIVNCNLKFNFHKDFANNGSFICQDINFIGELDHNLSCSDKSWIQFNGSLTSNDGKIIAKSNVYLKTSYNYLLAKEIILESGSNLYLNNVRFGKDGADYKNVIHGNNNFIYISGIQGWYQNCELHDVQLGGYSIVNSNADFYGEVINQDTLTNMGSNVTVNVFGNFTNNDMVFGQSYDMNFNYHQNFINNGYYASMFTRFIGAADQLFILLDNSNLAGWGIQFEANLDSTTTAYQWMKNDEDISEETNENLLFGGTFTSEEAVYQCKGTQTGGDVFSRKITVTNQFPPAFEITDVVIKNSDSASTLVTWKTGVPASGFIFYVENDPSNGYPLEAMESGDFITEHSLLLENLTFGSTYYFIIDQSDEGWNNNVRSEEFSFVAGDSLVSVKNNYQLPSQYFLSQNYPNPFNPSTVIEFALPTSGNVSLKVFNSIGEEVAELLNSEMIAGYHLVNFNASTSSATASNLSSGIYFYRISSGNFVQTNKMLLIR